MLYEIRCGIVLATILSTLAVTAAKAEDWCGYATGDHAVIECGYTTIAGCESAVGKGGMCFVDPDIALNPRHIGAMTAAKVLPQGKG